MAIQEVMVDTLEYTIALVIQESRKVLALANCNGYGLPSVEIPLWSRPAEELQKAIRKTWGIHAIILDFLPSVGNVKTVVAAQVLILASEHKLQPVEARSLHSSSMDEEQRKALESLLSDEVEQRSPFARLGWVNDAVMWVETVTSSRLASPASINQYNAGGPFSLVRFSMDDNRAYWMKATGEPNSHERSLTVYLSQLDRCHLPLVVATKPEWNAWLALGDASSLPGASSEPLIFQQMLASAVTSMARLQIEVLGSRHGLLNAGAFDQGTQALLARSEELFEYVAESMALQTSIKVNRLSPARVHELRDSFERMCLRKEALGICDSIVHGDLNPGNVLVGSDGCLFIDWAEAYVGNSIIGLQNLLLLIQVADPAKHDHIRRHLMKRYLEEWSAVSDPAIFTEAFRYMPALAIASALYGRGDWLDSPLRNDPRRRSFARTLTRCMDRAVRTVDREERLCH